MKPKSCPSIQRGGLQMIEEAFVLLRRIPAGLLALYYVGALPFILGLLYFWADMSRGAFADTRLTDSSLLVGLLFLWMKCWHTIFCRQLLAFTGEEPPLPWTAGRICRMIVVQTAVQPWALLARPIALLITLPYGWVRAFFENVTILGDGEDASIRAVCRRSMTQARLWPVPNNQSLGLLFLFGIFVFFNVGLLIVVLPSLLKILFGIESTFTKSAFSYFNSTFFASALAGTWLCLNPVTKAIYVLRCFHGAALQTGADLRVDLRKIRRIALAALWLVLAWTAVPLRAAVVAPSAPAVPSQILDHRIDEVLQRREFIWREPRQLSPQEQKSWLESFYKDLGDHLKQWLRPSKQWLKKFADWCQDWLRNRRENEEHDPGQGFDWGQPAKWLIIFLIVALIVALLLLWRRYRRPAPLTTISDTVAAIPDLASEDITAAQLPEEGWLQLAREMVAKGDLRLALRAFYLASLTLLGSREWVSLARYKSNRDYECELRRKGRGSPVVRENFAATLLAFERVWYGRHPATPEVLAEVQARLEKIRSC